MSEEPEIAVVAQGDLGHLRDVQNVLRREGLASHMIAPPDSCNGSCTPTMYLAVSNDDAQRAARIVFEHWGQGVDREALARALQPIDLDAEQTSCPACGTAFGPDATRCPSCKLKFG